MSKVYIYALTDPLDGAVCYVGRSKWPDARLSEHYRRANLELTTWLAGLSNQGQEPTVLILEECTGEGMAEREQHWIDKMRQGGHRLLNACDAVSSTRQRDEKIRTYYTTPELLSRMERLKEQWGWGESKLTRWLIESALELVDAGKLKPKKTTVTTFEAE